MQEICNARAMTGLVAIFVLYFLFSKAAQDVFTNSAALLPVGWFLVLAGTKGILKIRIPGIILFYLRRLTNECIGNVLHGISGLL
jgi:hypothetical protein